MRHDTGAALAVAEPTPLDVNERREAARQAYRKSLASGCPLPPKVLGPMFDRSPRWANDRILEVKAAARSNGGLPRPADSTAIPDLEQARDYDDGPGSVPKTEVETAASANTGTRWTALLITLAVAVVAAAASYGHLHEVAVMGGEGLWIARAFPVTVDGLVLAALLKGEAGKWWLRLGLLVSVAANVAAADSTPIGWAVAGWPPLALLGTHKLLHDPKGRD